MKDTNTDVQKAGQKWLNHIKQFEKLDGLFNMIPEPTRILFAQQIDIFAGKYPPEPDVQKAAEEYGRNHPFVEYTARTEAFLAGTQWKGDEVEALKKDEIPSRTDPRNWTEDYGHENGNYICHCYNCQRTFFGHKRRVVCKECSDKYESELEKAKKEIERLIMGRLIMFYLTMLDYSPPNNFTKSSSLNNCAEVCYLC